MQNRNIIDISDLPNEYHQLAYDFINYLKLKDSKPESNLNYDKIELKSLFKKIAAMNIFSDIDDAVEWQRELRDDR